MPPTPTAQLSADCIRALGNLGAAAVRNALKHADVIKQAATDNGVDPNVLAAIGVRETGFRPIYENGTRGGRGVGVWQIDRRYHGDVSIEQALNIRFSANYSAGLLSDSINSFVDRGYSYDLSVGAAIRGYNSSQKRTKRHPDVYTLLKSGTIQGLDVGTAHGNYVSQVLAIAKNCFSLR
jgi:soluble lytic murein transglycosylase-like protein